MHLDPSCPRCGTPLQVPTRDVLPSCPRDGAVVPLWRPDQVAYDSFAEVLGRATPVPTYLPWPMSPGWSVSDVGAVAGTTPGSGRASVTRTVGTTDPDGPVEITLVSEDPGVGLGARCAGVAMADPGVGLTREVPSIRVRAEGRAVPLWSIDPTDPAGADPLTRAVFAGESDGRWLWLVVRPAAAALLLRDDWLLADVTGIGPEALEMPFGGDRGEW